MTLRKLLRRLPSTMMVRPGLIVVTRVTPMKKVILTTASVPREHTKLVVTPPTSYLPKKSID